MIIAINTNFDDIEAWVDDLFKHVITKVTEGDDDVDASIETCYEGWTIQVAPYISKSPYLLHYWDGKIMYDKGNFKQLNDAVAHLIGIHR